MKFTYPDDKTRADRALVGTSYVNLTEVFLVGRGHA